MVVVSPFMRTIQTALSVSKQMGLPFSELEKRCRRISGVNSTGLRVAVYPDLPNRAETYETNQPAILRARDREQTEI